MIIAFQPPCRVQDHQPLDQAAQSHIQPGLECLQGSSIHNLLVQPVPVCHHPLCEKLPLISNLNLPCLSLRPFPLVLSLSTLASNCSPSCLYAPFKYWKAAMRSPRSLLFCKLNKPSSLNHSSQERCSSPLIILVALLCACSKSSTSFLCWGPQAWVQYSRWGLTRTEWRGTITSLSCWPPLF